MGNRAVITTKENFDNNGIGLYLHWNGGRDSVTAFLKYCELKGYRAPSSDCYGWARLAQVIGNFFGGSTSVGLDCVNKLDCDNWDNGVYFIDGWQIAGRKYLRGAEQNEYDLLDALKSIDEAQPEPERIGALLNAKEVPTFTLILGDTVAMIDNITGDCKEYRVIGFGKSGQIVNGTNVTARPYINRFENGNNAENINSYILTETAYLISTNPNPDPDPTDPDDDTDEAPAITTATPAELYSLPFAGLDGLTVTVKGAKTEAPVVWISGDTYQHREALKAAGCHWSRKRKAWYCCPAVAAETDAA